MESFALDKSVWAWENPRAGLFYLRIKTEDQGQVVFSSVTTLRIVLSAPLGEVVAVKDTSTPFLQVGWRVQAHPSAKQLEIEYSRSGGFQNPVKKTSLDLSGDIFVPEPGRYYFRFRSLNEKGWPVSAYSHSTVVDAILPVQPLKLVAPRVERVVASETPSPLVKPAKAETVVRSEDVDPHRKTVPQSKFHFLFGGGLTQYQLQQNDSVNLETSKLSGSMPLISAGFFYEFDEFQRMELIYATANKSVNATDGVQNNSANVSFEDLTVNYRKKLESSPLQNFAVVGGYSLRRVPLLSAGAGGDLLVDKMQLHFVSLGVDYHWPLLAEWDTMVGARMHALISGSAATLDGFKISPSVQWELALNGRRRVFSHFFIMPNLSYRLQKFDYDFAGGGQGSQNSSELSLHLSLQYEF